MYIEWESISQSNIISIWSPSSKMGMKIVNGVIVRDGDALPEDSGGSSGSGSDDFLSSVGAHDTISLCGSNIPKWQLAVMVLFSFMMSGIQGALVTGAIIGGVYLYGQQEGSGSAASRSMPVRSGANIRTMKDLPPMPKTG